MKNPDSSRLTRRQFLKISTAAGGVAAFGGTVPFYGAYAVSPPKVNVGMIAPFTGSGGEFGVFYHDAAQLAVTQANKAATQFLGGPVIKNLYAEDSNTLATPGIAAAKKLIEANGATSVLCCWSSGVTVAVATSATLPAQVLQVGYATSSPLVTYLPEDKDRDLLFRTSPSDLLQGKVAAQLASGQIIKKHKFKTVSSIYINNPYGQGLSNSFTKAFEAMGGSVLSQVPHPAKVQATYKSVIAKALRDKPDLLFLPTYPAHTAVILKESRDIFDFTKWQLTDANKSTVVLSAVGDALNGTWGTTPGVYTDRPGYQAFKKAYTETVYHHDRIPPFTAYAYDAGALLSLAIVQAIVKGKITESNQLTGSIIRDQLRSIADTPGEEVIIGSQDGMNRAVQLIKQGKEINVTGISSPVEFDEHGDVVTPYEIWAVEKGRIVNKMIWPSSKIPTDLYS